MRFALLVLFALGCKKPPPPKMPLNPPEGSEASAFTQKFIDFARRANPSLHLTPAGDLAVQGDKGGTMQLANLWFECQTDPAICDTAMARWVRTLSRPDGAAVDVNNLRLQLFPVGVAEDKLIRRDFVGPLVQALVVDSPDDISSLSRDQAQKLGLSDDALFQAALANLGAAFPEKIEGQPLGENAPANLRVGNFPDGYGGARLFLHERWKALAASGTLLVAAPARDLVIWIAKPDEQQAVAFRWLAQQMVAHEPHPISPAIFRWTASAWVLEDANEKPVER